MIRCNVASLLCFVILGSCQSQYETQHQLESEGNRRFGVGWPRAHGRPLGRHHGGRWPGGGSFSSEENYFRDYQEQLDFGQLKHEGSENEILDPYLSKPAVLGEETGGENRGFITDFIRGGVQQWLYPHGPGGGVHYPSASGAGGGHSPSGAGGANYPNYQYGETETEQPTLGEEVVANGESDGNRRRGIGGIIGGIINGIRGKWPKRPRIPIIPKPKPFPNIPKPGIGGGVGGGGINYNYGYGYEYDTYDGDYQDESEISFPTFTKAPESFPSFLTTTTEHSQGEEFWQDGSNGGEYFGNIHSVMVFIKTTAAGMTGAEHQQPQQGSGGNEGMRISELESVQPIGSLGNRGIGGRLRYG